MTKAKGILPGGVPARLTPLELPPEPEARVAGPGRPGPALPPGSGFVAPKVQLSLAQLAELRLSSVRAEREKAPEKVARVSGLPEGISAIRRAGPADAEGIAEIQGRLQLRKMDVSDHPENGWLLQLSTPEQIRFAMARYKDYWVAEGEGGRILAYQTVSHPRFISRPAEKHRFFGPQADRAYEIIEQASFIYMSQIASVPEGRGKGWGSALQAKALEAYQDLPLAAHVGVFTGDDLKGWDGDPAHLVAHKNNVASHRFHQKHGYVPVAWTSDLPVEAFNSGLPAASGGDGVLGILYVNFRDGRVGTPESYVDPVQAVVGSPMTEADRDPSPWRNPFPFAWPDREVDLSFDEGSFMPNVVGLQRYFEEKHEDELGSLRRPPSGAEG